jgi:hypothetical protein
VHEVLSNGVLTKQSKQGETKNGNIGWKTDESVFVDVSHWEI